MDTKTHFYILDLESRFTITNSHICKNNSEADAKTNLYILDSRIYIDSLTTVVRGPPNLAPILAPFSSEICNQNEGRVDWTLGDLPQG